MNATIILSLVVVELGIVLWASLLHVKSKRQ